MFSESMLRNTARILIEKVGITSAGYYPDDRNDSAFVWISAGVGEIQIAVNGDAWWFKWDRTHAVSGEKELFPPATVESAVLAEWLISESRKIYESESEPYTDHDAGFGGQDITYET